MSRAPAWLAADVRRGFGPWWVGVLQSTTGERHFEYHTDLHALALLLSTPKTSFYASLFLGPFENQQDASDVANAWMVLVQRRAGDVAGVGKRLHLELHEDDPRLRFYDVRTAEPGSATPVVACHSLIGDVRKRAK